MSVYEPSHESSTGISKENPYTPPEPVVDDMNGAPSRSIATGSPVLKLPLKNKEPPPSRTSPRYRLRSDTQSVRNGPMSIGGGFSPSPSKRSTSSTPTTYRSSRRFSRSSINLLSANGSMPSTSSSMMSVAVIIIESIERFINAIVTVARSMAALASASSSTVRFTAPESDLSTSRASNSASSMSMNRDSSSASSVNGGRSSSSSPKLSATAAVSWSSLSAGSRSDVTADRFDLPPEVSSSCNAISDDSV